MNAFKKILLAGIATAAFWSAPAVSGAQAISGAEQAQTYTQTVQRTSPVLLKGSEQEKVQLEQLYQNLGRSETGRSILRQMDEIYERTGSRLPLSFGPMDPTCGGRYVSATAGIVLNAARSDSVDEIILAHESKHYIQENRPKTTLVQTLKSNIAVAAADLNENTPAQTTSLIKSTLASKGR